MNGATATVNVGIGTPNPHSRLHVVGSYATSFTPMTANLTLNATHHVVYRTGGTITLPSPASCTGRVYIIVNRNTTAASISPYADFAGFIQNTILPNSSITIISNGTDWLRIQ
ncbi:MAG: hypothetical protein KatS3mg035_0360 [Bacteroidia bacterium]|nr:MAG: hypothetical protein KatS3mg035_0360 [Bacteroidia bacterium]